MYRHKAVTAAKFLNQLITKLELATITMGIGTQVSIGYGAFTGLMGTAVSPVYAASKADFDGLLFRSDDEDVAVHFGGVDYTKGKNNEL